MSGITSHVLDTVLGRPAIDLSVRLTFLDSSGAWALIGETRTNAQGRAVHLTPNGEIDAGTYRLTFETGSYFRALQQDTFYPQVEVIFRVQFPQEHYHVPLLLSPFGYSTYRGS